MVGAWILDSKEQVRQYAPHAVNRRLRENPGFEYSIHVRMAGMKHEPSTHGPTFA